MAKVKGTMVLGFVKVIRADKTKAYYYVLVGWIEECLRLSGALHPKGGFRSKSWEGHPETSIEFSWSA